jgi:hypothetical protein
MESDKGRDEAARQVPSVGPAAGGNLAWPVLNAPMLTLTTAFQGRVACDGTTSRSKCIDSNRSHYLPLAAASSKCFSKTSAMVRGNSCLDVKDSAVIAVACVPVTS